MGIATGIGAGIATGATGSGGVGGSAYIVGGGELGTIPGKASPAGCGTSGDAGAAAGKTSADSAEPNDGGEIGAPSATGEGAGAAIEAGAGMVGAGVGGTAGNAAAADSTGNS